MTRNDKIPSSIETTGHTWDGIEELNNPLPRWWLWVLYATIVWGVGYTIAYPAWPLVSGATSGLLGFSTRGDVAADIAATEAARSGLMDRLAAADLSQLPQDPELQAFAVSAGASVFGANCAQCHGAGAAGVQAGGFPNLLDDDWLWGGTITDVAATVTHGIRNESSPDARWSEMPAFGEILEGGDIDAVVNHVLAVSGQEHDAALAEQGSVVFADNCASCHGEDATGMREMGAPNLTDAVWLYGGTAETLKETVTNARFGVMPAWSEEFRPANGLSQAEINAVAAYVHGLGGGE
ncbi:cytochrome-c oxidase, cbb3-type subunit III [Rubellimicrobium aerolatum]|uniref:Cbb3-type cytochrome c oxidase subunit n=1 Tax=Rubellimicrobium aerolatum TaxID=490979 RepID=A0ABW0SFU5_9RHOB|nr:cytochrome-c oxidase, cbb3-type subunit III [Rubellimicrobium aerolatum]MBP1807251.1 cytochrome c oxidase cbb3-type subunit 3 [Rubellimicrobium aerolatum]